MEDGGGAVLEPKDLSGIGKSEEEVFIQLNCGSRVRSGRRLFKAEYVLDCVRKGRLLPDLSEYLCKQEEEHRKGDSVSRHGIKEGKMEGARDPFEVFFLKFKEYCDFHINFRFCLDLRAGKHIYQMYKRRRKKGKGVQVCQIVQVVKLRRS